MKNQIRQDWLNVLFPSARWKINFFIAALFFLPGMSVAQEEKREWQYCAQDGDCIVVGGGCTMIAVNKQFKAEGENYANQMNAKVECIRYLDPTKATATCTHNKVPCMSPSGEIDPAATCLSKKAKCSVIEQIVD